MVAVLKVAVAITIKGRRRRNCSFLFYFDSPQVIVLSALADIRDTILLVLFFRSPIFIGSCHAPVVVVLMNAAASAAKQCGRDRMALSHGHD